MARLRRLTIAGYPHHVIQRGNNRQIIFVDDADRRWFLALLAEYAEREKVALHAYVLMSNHVHLLLTPDANEGVPRMMQAVGRRYVQYYNHRHLRTGTLWEGRYRSTLVDTDRYLLACMVYIELNPVRAGLVAQPADYPWSSYGYYVGLRQDHLVKPHSIWWALGNTPFAREAAYRDLVAQGIGADQQNAMTEALLKGWAAGRPEFIKKAQVASGRRTAKAQAGRPRGINKI